MGQSDDIGQVHPRFVVSISKDFVKHVLVIHWVGLVELTRQFYQWFPLKLIGYFNKFPRVGRRSVGRSFVAVWGETLCKVWSTTYGASSQVVALFHYPPNKPATEWMMMAVWLAIHSLFTIQLGDERPTRPTKRQMCPDDESTPFNIL